MGLEPFFFAKNTDVFAIRFPSIVIELKLSDLLFFLANPTRFLTLEQTWLLITHLIWPPVTGLRLKINLSQMIFRCKPIHKLFMQFTIAVSGCVVALMSLGLSSISPTFQCRLRGKAAEGFNRLHFELHTQIEADVLACVALQVL